MEVSPTLIIILVVANIPIYLIVGRAFFGRWCKVGRIRTDERQPFVDRLGNEQAVERVAMMVRQTRQCVKCSIAMGRSRIAARSNSARTSFGDRLAELNFAKRNLALCCASNPRGTRRGRAGQRPA